MISINGIVPGMLHVDVIQVLGEPETKSEVIPGYYTLKFKGRVFVNFVVGRNEPDRAIQVEGREMRVDHHVFRAGDSVASVGAVFPIFVDENRGRVFQIGPSRWMRVMSLDGHTSCSAFTYPYGPPEFRL